MLRELIPKVAVVKANSYERRYLDERLRDLLRLIGGLESYVKPGMKVLLKPNLLSAKPPEWAITTHPELVAAVAEMVRALGAEVKIGDSPAGAKTGIKRVWDNTGLAHIASRDNLELVGFERAGTRPLKVDRSTYYVSRPVLEADLVINLPKLKTHVLTLMTGAVKNMFGVIPGFRKGMYHKEAPNPRHFARVVVDIFSTVQPALNIMDAIWVMEGDGPASGTVRPGNMLLASTDAVAMDTVAASIMGLNPQKVHTIRYAADAGLGIGWLEGIALVGHRLGELKLDNFKLTSNLGMELLPKFLMDAVGPFVWMRPKADENICLMCGECVKSCPTRAMKQPDDDSTPMVDKDLCINCWCCHEICPENAIYITKSWLARKFIR
ncbi:MAG: DUF362 domain-containing protein [candidate division Zixibacteria bacterium]|nr:DUF362 domain-containing protein [candidate division Zixibacteria bacterium]